MAKKVNEAKKEKRVKIRILPLRGIGGIGSAGDTAWLPIDEAEQWVKDGYVEIISTDEPEPIESSVDPENNQLELSGSESDHIIMQPENKRD